MPRPALLLTRDFPPHGGGIARALGEIVRHAKPGSLLVSAGRCDGDLAHDTTFPSPVYRAPVDSARLRTLSGLVRWARDAERLVDVHEPEFLWAGNLKPAGHVVRWLADRHRLPYGLLVYGQDLLQLHRQVRRSPIKRFAARRILERATIIVAISEWTRERFLELAGDLGLVGAGERCVVVPLGVDAERFHPEASDEAFVRRLGRGPVRWLLTVARLVPHKGVDIGLAVLDALRRDHPDVGYLVAGEGPARAELEARATRLGIADRVRFLGHVAEADLPALYAASSVYLGLSREEGVEAEGFGLSLLEASASGLAVVAGASGGTAEVVVDGETGYRVPPTDAPAIADRVHTLLADPARARAMGTAGRARAVAQFSWRRVAGDLASLARHPSGRSLGSGGR